jgi:hypothetical protein
VVASDWPSFVRKSGLRADSFLARLSDREFDQGMAMLRAHRANINSAEAVTEEIDWFVFTLMAYGGDLAELGRRMADDVHQILDGAKPGDIPIYQAAKFELVINLKTAKALGLNIPAALLATADDVVE